MNRAAVAPRPSVLVRTPTSTRTRRGVTAGLVAVVLGATALAVPFAAHAAPGPWQPQTTLSVTGAAAFDPTTTTAPDGSVVAVWVQEQPTDAGLLIATKAKDATAWSAPAHVGPPAGTDVVDASVVVDAAGTTIVAWQRDVSGYNTVWTSERRAGAAAWSTPAQISVTHEAFSPKLATGGGVTVVVYEQVGASFGSASTLTVRYRTATGGWSAPRDVGVADEPTEDARVAVDPVGNVTVVWTYSDDDTVFARALNDDPCCWGDEKRLSPVGQPSHAPSIGVSDSNVVVAFISYVGGDYLVRSTSHTTPFSAWTTAGGISGSTPGSIEAPVVTVARDGSAAAVWVSDNSGTEVQAARRSAAGVWSPAVPLNVGPAVVTSATIAGSGDGSVIAAWAQKSGSDYLIESSRGSTTAAGWSTVLPLSPTGAIADVPALSVAFDGATTLLFQQFLGATVTVQARSTALPAPTVATAAKATGVAKTGSTLTCTSALTRATTTTITWTRNGATVGTGATRKLTGADFGKTIACRVTATNAAGSATSTSAGVVVKVAPSKNLTKPKITGKAKVGKKLKATKGTWAAAPTTVSYQWYRGAKKIKGQTKATHKVVAKDKGKRLHVKVTVKATGYTTVSAVSKNTKKVAKR